MRRLPTTEHTEYDDRTFARMMNKTRITDSGCWLFTGSGTRNGYGITTYHGDVALVHRWSYAYSKGPIPDGMSVCHTCDNRRCWNPSHLWLGTLWDNLADMKAKGRSHGQKRDACYRGHKYVEGSFMWRNADGKGWRRQCNVCNRIRQRIRAGWTKEQAETLEVTPHGHRPVGGTFKRTADR